MKISIVIPLYNKEAYILRALKSIQDQYPLEVIIVDDNSTDRGVNVVSSFIESKINSQINWILLKTKWNGGPGVARNVGIDHAKGDYIAFLDADDEYSPDYIAYAKELMSKHKYDALIFKVRYQSNALERPFLKNVFDDLLSIEDGVFILENVFSFLAKESLIIGNGNIICRRELIGKLRYNVNERAFEDWEFWYRVFSEALKCKRVLFSNYVGMYHHDEIEGTLQRRNMENYKDIKVPNIINILQNINSLDSINYRARIVSIWVYNSVKRLSSAKQKLRFIWKERALIVRNVSVNRYFIGVLVEIFLGNYLGKYVGKKYRNHFYHKKNK